MTLASRRGMFEVQKLQEALEVMSQIQAYGEYGAKIETLLRRLIYLQQHHPEIKSLVRITVHRWPSYQNYKLLSCMSPRALACAR